VEPRVEGGECCGGWGSNTASLTRNLSGKRRGKEGRTESKTEVTLHTTTIFTKKGKVVTEGKGLRLWGVILGCVVEKGERGKEEEQTTRGKKRDGIPRKG